MRTSILIAIAVVAVAGVAQAADLYSTDFEAPTFSPGTINAQDSWVVGNGDGTSTDGMIVDDGTGNQVLSVSATNGGWGDEVRRDYDAASTLQYLVVEMDFQMKDGASFYFMDNNQVAGGTGTGGPESIYWDDWEGEHSVYSNASPGIAHSLITYDTWYHVGIEVDQQSKEITGWNFQGTWTAENDTPDGAMQMARLVFRAYGYEEGRHLWIDNLSITDGSTTVIPEPSVFLLAGLGLLALLRRRR